MFFANLHMDIEIMASFSPTDGDSRLLNYLSYKVTVVGAGLCNAGAAAREIRITSDGKEAYSKDMGPAVAFGPSLQGQEKLANIYQYDAPRVSVGSNVSIHVGFNLFASRIEMKPGENIPSCGDAVLDTAIIDLPVP
jgi:hypothetical protein